MNTLAAVATTFVLSLGSHHWDAEGMNERNPGLGVQTETVAAGYFLNSRRKDSFYLAYPVEREAWWGRYGVLAGVVSGYSHLDAPGQFGRLTPTLIPYVEFGNLRLVQMRDATGFQLTWEF